MSYKSLQNFIDFLQKKDELTIINAHVSPLLEISEITDRVSKNKGKALLFKNNGTKFPVITNMFGSEYRMLQALGLRSYNEFNDEIEAFFQMTDTTKKLNITKAIKQALKLRYSIPKHLKRKGICQKNEQTEVDLSKLPILQCWPDDAGKFITLPMVHTIDPEDGSTNVGMYRMQVFNNKTTGMHWHRHKGGATHFEKYKALKKRMPVVVTLGGNPIYTYISTAPLPEMINEYAFAGFIQKRRIKLVKALTCDIKIPEDVDFVIEGYIDPEEELKTEGPFGDHTGYYSLTDYYPIFHITKITHKPNAIYPATVVGVPPMEDGYLGKATERLFFPLIKKFFTPELIEVNIPIEGGFHNLLIASIKKTYPGQAIKVMNALWGAGQMMFVKNIIIVDKDVDVFNINSVLDAISKNVNIPYDFSFFKGPLDVLDHANNSFTFGRKMGIDATVKLEEEKQAIDNRTPNQTQINFDFSKYHIKNIDLNWAKKSYKIAIIFVNKDLSISIRNIHKKLILEHSFHVPYMFFFDSNAECLNYNELLWLFLANYNPETDLFLTSLEDKTCFAGFDGTMKTTTHDNLQTSRANIITMDSVTISNIDARWSEFGFSEILESPSLLYKKITLNEGYLYEKQKKL